MRKAVYYPLSPDTEHAQLIRKIIQESLEMLALPQADTFLGRKRHEPFPKEAVHDKLG